MPFDNDIDLAFAQSTLKFGKQANFSGKWLISGSRARAYQQVNIATLLAIVHPRAKQPDTHVLAKYFRAGRANSRLLLLRKAHRLGAQASLREVPQMQYHLPDLLVRERWMGWHRRAG